MPPMTKSTAAPVVTYVLLLCTVLFWGTSFPATKLVLRSFGPVSYVFLRFLAASLIFWPLLLYRSRRTGRSLKLGKSVHIKLALLALFEPGLYFLFESVGMQYTSASSASLIIAAVPALVALLARFTLKEKLISREWVGIFLSVSGALLLAAFDDNAAYAESSLLGNSLVMGAAISAAVYMIVARHLSSRFSAFEITSYQVFFGALYFLPLFLFRLPAIEWELIGVEAIAALLFLIVAATLLAFFFYNTALSRIDASKAAVFLNGIPIVSVIISALFLGENLGLIQLLGGGIVVVGVTLTNLRRNRNRTTLEG